MERLERARAFGLPSRVAGARLERWIAYLAAPIDGASIALFRICFGAIMLWEVGRYFANGWIVEDYVEPAYLFGYVSFIRPWPGDGMYWHFAAMGVLAAMVAAGFFYRVAAALFFLAFTYVFLLDKTQYQNHHYLISLVSLLMAAIPAHQAWSIDRAIGRHRGDETVPRWALHALRLQIILVYFFGGVAKLNGDWLRGEPLTSWLLDASDVPVLGPLLSLEYTGLLFAWGGLLLDLSVGFLLLWRRTFWLGVAMSIAFHLLNSQMFTIGIFPFFMLATLGLFPAPDWPRRRAAKASAGERTEARALGAGIAVLALVHVYFLVQFALPLRHWLYPGDVNWTEEGHRFSWRMKLRDKEVVDFRMTATDPRTEKRWIVDPYDYLTDRQYGKMMPRPDMIHQFALHVADDYEREHGIRPTIRVRARLSLNGRPARDLIDPSADLASIQPSIGPAAWIVP
jgi:vitamin K-dependent gamma-carboxylase